MVFKSLKYVMSMKEYQRHPTLRPVPNLGEESQVSDVNYTIGPDSRVDSKSQEKVPVYQYNLR